ncbi:MAG: IS1634 family transposase [Desulfobacterales bacterium]|nr:IS1634 family transposase [Desulfobacterales bacterium]
MSENPLHSVETQGVGFAPILGHYFERCGIAKIIDEDVPCDSRRKVLTHGEASVAMITGILFQVPQLYNLSKFAEATDILKIILPDIEACEYFDDRLADTLDALYSYGLGNLEMQITKQMMSEFNITSEICHNDTTSASVYGDCNNNRTDKSIEITFGYSKKHRKDLKQFIWSLSVSTDSAFPLFQQAYSGNTADTDTYVKQWSNLTELLGRRDFLYVCDSKLISKENITLIHDDGGFFIAPAPMYESYKSVFYKALEEHDREILIPYKDGFNRGFEVPLSFMYKGKEYTFRMIILYDPGLFAVKSLTHKEHIAKTEAAFKEIEEKLNKYNLKTETSIDKACTDILKKYKTVEFFDYTIINEPVITYKNAKRGRPTKGKPCDKVAVTKDCFSLTLQFKEEAFEQALFRCGYYPMITNQSPEELSIEDAMSAHKNQYKSEHTNRRAKSGYNLEPIYLHTPERIEAWLFLFKIVLQILVLIERTARKNIEQRDKGLDNFRPNRKDVRNPKAEYLLGEFQYIAAVLILMNDGTRLKSISALNVLQKDILAVLDVPLECFTSGRFYEKFAND